MISPSILLKEGSEPWNSQEICPGLPNWLATEQEAKPLPVGLQPMPCSLNFSLLRRKTWRLTVETTEEDGCTGQNRFPDASHRAIQLTVVKARVGEAWFKIGSPLPMCSQELCCPYKTYTGKYFFYLFVFERGKWKIWGRDSSIPVKSDK